MFRSRIFLPPLLTVLIVLGACQGEGKFKGEVFIVTEGRENIKMGLVQVRAIETSTLDAHLKDRFATAQNKVKYSAARVSTLLDSIAQLRRLSRQVDSNYRETKAKRTALRRRINRVKNKIDSVESDIFDSAHKSVSQDGIMKGSEVYTYDGKTELYNGPGRGFSVVDIVNKGSQGEIVEVFESSFYRADFGGKSGWIHPDDIISEGEYVRAIKLKDKMDNKLSELESNINQNEYYSEEVETRIFRLEAKIGTNIDSINSELNRIESRRRNGFFFDKLPESASTDKTDSDGNYELTVEGGVPYYLVAQASRSVGDGEEKYYWMVKTTVEGGGEKELSLTNENLGGVADKKYALSERTFSTVKEIWDSAVSLAKEGEELDWERLIYRTAFPDDTMDTPIPDDLDVPQKKLLSD